MLGVGVRGGVMGVCVMGMCYGGGCYGVVLWGGVMGWVLCGEWGEVVF